MHPSKRRKYYKQKLQDFYYHKIYQPWRAFVVRHKRKISVVFAIADLSCWKTESLYRAMLTHPRFRPILVMVSFPGKEDYENMEHYFQQKDYEYERVDDNETIIGRFHPDILFYQQPYEYVHIDNHMYHHNMQTLFCYATYSLRSSTNSWNTHLNFLNNCWQVYYENELSLETYRKLNENHAVNGLATGLPVMDDLMTPKEEIPDPWKASIGKKRIIYAPHHTIVDNQMFQTSTFLTIGPLMLELAEKYSDRVQWAFKPHPFLRVKLEEICGKKATDEYYERWANVEWSQYEHGEYIGLFKHSDAMIHDCGSFTMEYLFTCNPVMYLTLDRQLPQEYNEMHKQAFAVHYQGNTRELIERFINIVLSGNDPLKSRREQYRQRYLIPPGGSSACQNIIKAILGK